MKPVTGFDRPEPKIASTTQSLLRVSGKSSNRLISLILTFFWYLRLSRFVLKSSDDLSEYLSTNTSTLKSFLKRRVSRQLPPQMEMTPSNYLGKTPLILLFPTLKCREQADSPCLNTSKIQIATLFLVIAYIIWEIYVRVWSNSQPEGGGAIIRVDLLIIYPILLVLIIISIYQYFKK